MEPIKGKMKKKAKPEATVYVENCVFNSDLGERLPLVQELARAIAANAEAIRSLAKVLEGPSTLLSVGARSND